MITQDIRPGLVCRHHSRRIYTIIDITNTAHPSEKFPATVHYIGANGQRWSRPLAAFRENFAVVYDGAERKPHPAFEMVSRTIAETYFYNGVLDDGYSDAATVRVFQDLAAEGYDIVQQKPFQSRVMEWFIACFGKDHASDKKERNYRFLEEALELVQAMGCSRDEALQLVDYVYSRPVGVPAQEVGGVMVTLAALCLVNGLNMHVAGEIELGRIWTKMDKIRAKYETKPKNSPLPGNVSTH